MEILDMETAEKKIDIKTEEDKIELLLQNVILVDFDLEESWKSMM